MTASGRLAKRAVVWIYSQAAERVYEPVVVRRAFPLLGGNLNDIVLRQGHTAALAARGRPILDMPVGTAFFALETARRHRGTVVGVDLAQGMVAKARGAAAREGIRNLVVVRADAHHLPFRDSTFGAVLCSNGLQVIAGLDATIAELVRVLSPGGSIFLSFLSVPLLSAFGEGTRRAAPTLLRPSEDVRASLAAAGVPAVIVRKQRLATAISGIKPERVVRSAG